ncbi:hypothetical protein [Nocardia sp. NPDC057455]|uniref:hypothetical protein n=1 Tax=Nocardia sp. NPDC057455 TaxID=3346138 RepID=UPI00366FAB57
MTRTVSTIPEWDAFIHDADAHGVTAVAGGPIADLLRYWLCVDDAATIELVAAPNVRDSDAGVYSLDVKTGERHVNLSGLAPYTWAELMGAGLFAGQHPYQHDMPDEVRERSRELLYAVADTWERAA